MVFMSILNKISNFLKKRTGASEKEDNKARAVGYTGKFVKQNGTDIGESVAVTEKGFIVKNPEAFMSIPFEAVVTNSEIIAVGDFNREECIQLGKEWFERKDTLKFDEKGMLVK
jgi:hypothetical protein